MNKKFPIIDSYAYIDGNGYACAYNVYDITNVAKLTYTSTACLLWYSNDLSTWVQIPTSIAPISGTNKTIELDKNYKYLRQYVGRYTYFLIE